MTLLTMLRREPIAVLSAHDARVLAEQSERYEQILSDAGILGICTLCGDAVTDRSSAIVERPHPYAASAILHAQCWVDEQERVESRYRFADFLDGQAGR